MGERVKARRKASRNNPGKTSVPGLRHALNMTWLGWGPVEPQGLRCGSGPVCPLGGNLLTRNDC